MKRTIITVSGWTSTPLDQIKTTFQHDMNEIRDRLISNAMVIDGSGQVWSIIQWLLLLKALGCAVFMKSAVFVQYSHDAKTFERHLISPHMQYPCSI
eukprot:m.558419 g.558419  ORF g.558419 m.558419 type:complete len:97 (+) comp22200_c0_seq5:450-740(+)